MDEVYKAVFQLPETDLWDESLTERLRWQETSDPHGPHIKVYPHKTDAETGRPCVHVRCKHRTLADLATLMRRVVSAIEEVEE